MNTSMTQADLLGAPDPEQEGDDGTENHDTADRNPNRNGWAILGTAAGMTPQNLNPGVFEIVDADGDIVHLGWDSECHAAGRRGWVNVGAHAVLIALDDNGDLYVEAYPLDNELNPTATLSVKKEAAMKAGALDGDAG